MTAQQPAALVGALSVKHHITQGIDGIASLQRPAVQIWEAVLHHLLALPLVLQSAGVTINVPPLCIASADAYVVLAVAMMKE